MPQGTESLAFSFKKAKQYQFPAAITKANLLWFTVNPPFQAGKTKVKKAPY